MVFSWLFRQLPLVDLTPAPLLGGEGGQSGSCPVAALVA